MIVAIVVSYNGGEDLLSCLDGLRAARVRTVVVDNASTDGTPARVRERHSDVHLVESAVNLGYAGGAALGWEYARARVPDCRYVAVLNQDLVISGEWLAPLSAFLDANPRAAAAQPLLLLEDGKRINTAGNRCHYLGFCFMTGYEQPVEDLEVEPREIDAVSGAAFLLRAEAIAGEALFNADYFMYLEDTELSWRLRQRGLGVWLVPSARVQHRYRYQAPLRYYYRLERNRLALLFTYYRWPTLLLLAPAALLMDFGQWLFAARHRLLRERLRVYRELLSPKRIAALRTWRAEARLRRKIGDRAFAGRFSGTIDFAPLRGPLVRWVANPLLGAYWRIVRSVLCW